MMPVFHCFVFQIVSSLLLVSPLCLLQVVEDDSGVLEVVMAAAEVETVSHQLVAGIGR